MAIKDLTNWNQAQSNFEREIETFLRKAVEFLSTVGKRACKYAVENGNYTDRTKFLRESIGYMVVQNGMIKVDAFGASDAQQVSRQYLLGITRDHPTGTVLLWGTGVVYGRCLEAKGLDVATGSENYIESQARSLAREFEQYMLST